MISFYEKNKSTLLFAIVSIFFVHTMKFVNYYPCWDSMYGIEMTYSGMYGFGRWFSGIAEILLSSKYDLQWVMGVICAIFIAVTITLVVDMLNLYEKRYSLPCVFLFVAFPSFAATFAYSLWSPAYMLSLLLACLSVYFTIEYSGVKYRGFAVGAIVISLAIYQIYILFAVALLCVYFINELLMHRLENARLVLIVKRYVATLTIGTVIYYLINLLLQKIGGYEMSSYQGISEVGHMTLTSIMEGIKKIVLSCGYFFAGSKTISAYGIINILIAFCIMVIFFKYVLFSNKYINKDKLLICILYVSIVPISYALFLVSPGVGYHKLMELGNYFLYLVPILILKENKKNNSHKEVYVVLLCILGFYHFLNDNIAYQQLSMSYERTYFEAAEVMHEIDRINDRGISKIMVIGNFQEREPDIIAIPKITGASTNNFLQSEYHLLKFAKYYLNRNYTACSGEEREVIIKQINWEEMNRFPNGKYVTIINDVVVVCLSD